MLRASVVLLNASRTLAHDSDRAPALLAFLVFAACSSESASDIPMETGDQRVSTMVDAKAEATLLLDDGARVRLPPGALASDAQVSFSREACDGVYASQRFQSCVYRVEAPEAVLNERTTLSLAIRDERDAPTRPHRDLRAIAGLRRTPRPRTRRARGRVGLIPPSRSARSRCTR